MKKALWMILAALTAALVLCTAYAALGGAENAWSRRLCRAIREGDANDALDLMDEGAERGYSMDALTHPRTLVSMLLETTIATPLETAICAGDVALARALLERGACPDNSATATIGGTGNNGAPVWYVLGPQYAPTDLPMLQLLAEYGATFAEDVPGDPLIHRAARRSAATCDLPEGGSTPENAARGVTEVFRFLAQYKDVHVTVDGQSVLHIAAGCGNWPLCRALVEEYGLDTSLRMADGRTAYDLALENGAPQELLARLIPEG